MRGDRTSFQRLWELAVISAAAAMAFVVQGWLLVLDGWDDLYGSPLLPGPFLQIVSCVLVSCIGAWCGFHLLNAPPRSRALQFAFAAAFAFVAAFFTLQLFWFSTRLFAPFPDSPSVASRAWTEHLPISLSAFAIAWIPAVLWSVGTRVSLGSVIDSLRAPELQLERNE